MELFGSITEIGDEAFRNCTNITELTLPESLTTIGSGALEGCTGITELTLPESLTTDRRPARSRAAPASRN